MPQVGAVVVPINYRLTADDFAYIVQHSGARVLCVDPELEESLQGVECEFKFVIGAANDAPLDHAEPRPWIGDEDATRIVAFLSTLTGELQQP